ncbi:MAG: hypothetical protein K2X87_05110, partial [Gemmataceae bacterium]|nr:hypothetical protein [Gemmataceae bacterium]
GSRPPTPGSSSGDSTPHLKSDDRLVDLAELCTTGFAPYSTLAELPVRGALEVNGTLYVVVGDVLAKYTSTGAGGTLTRLGNLNTGSGRVSITCNTVEIAISDRQYGYVYHLANGTFAGIPTTGSYPAAGVTNLTYQDGYVLGGVNGSKRIVQSDLLAAGSFQALAFVEVTSFPDDLVSVFSDQLQLYIFGPKVTEVRFNSTATPFAFEQRPGVLIQAGAITADAILKVGDTVFWLARSATRKAFVAALSGYTAKPVSTPALNEALERYSVLDDAYAFSYAEGDSQFFGLTFPTEGATHVLDVTSGQWHERSYQGGPDLPTCCVAWNGMNVVGGADGKLYAMSQEYSQIQRNRTVTASGAPVISYTRDQEFPARIRTSPHFEQDGRTIFLHEFEVEFEAGVGLTGDDPGGNGVMPANVRRPKASLRVSRDGGHTWTGVGTREIGASGKYRNRAIWRNLGRARKFTFELTVSDPVRTYVLGARGNWTLGAK